MSRYEKHKVDLNPAKNLLNAKTTQDIDYYFDNYGGFVVHMIGDVGICRSIHPGSPYLINGNGATKEECLSVIIKYARNKKLQELEDENNNIS